MTRNLSILGAVALLLLGAVVLRGLMQVKPLPTPEWASADAAPDPSDEPEPADSLVEVEPPAKYPPGTIWLDAPEVMEVDKTYEVRVMLNPKPDARSWSIEIKWSSASLSVWSVYRPRVTRVATLAELDHPFAEWGTVSKPHGTIALTSDSLESHAATLLITPLAVPDTGQCQLEFLGWPFAGFWRLTREELASSYDAPKAVQWTTFVSAPIRIVEPAR